MAPIGLVRFIEGEEDGGRVELPDREELLVDGLDNVGLPVFSGERFRNGFVPAEYFIFSLAEMLVARG